MTLFFSGTFSASEYLRSASRTLYSGRLFLLPSICTAPRGLFDDAFFQRYFFFFRVSAQCLEDSLFWSSFLASEYLRSSSRTLVGLFHDAFFQRYFFCFRVSAQHLEDSCRTPQGLFILAVLSSLSSIFSALPEDSLFWSYFPAFEYLRSASRTLSRVPAQGPETVLLTSI